MSPPRPPTTAAKTDQLGTRLHLRTAFTDVCEIRPAFLAMVRELGRPASACNLRKALNSAALAAAPSEGRAASSCSDSPVCPSSLIEAIRRAALTNDHSAFVRNCHNYRVYSDCDHPEILPLTSGSRGAGLLRCGPPLRRFAQTPGVVMPAEPEPATNRFELVITAEAEVVKAPSANSEEEDEEEQ